MTFKQALRQARTVYMFSVVRQADDRDSACGYIPVSKANVQFQMRHGFLQHMEPQFHMDDNELFIG